MDDSIFEKSRAKIYTFLYNSDDEIIAECCQTIASLTETANSCERIRNVVAAGLCPRLVELSVHESRNVAQWALKAVGNIITGDDWETQVVLNSGILPILSNLLDSPNELIKKDACWMISNITAGNHTQIQV